MRVHKYVLLSFAKVLSTFSSTKANREEFITVSFLTLRNSAMLMKPKEFTIVGSAEQTILSANI